MTTEFERVEFESIVAAQNRRAMKEQEPQCRKLGSIVVPVLQGNETARSRRYLRGSILSLAPQVKVGAPYFAPENRVRGGSRTRPCQIIHPVYTFAALP
jgi:hypothetical protein